MKTLISNSLTSFLIIIINIFNVTSETLNDIAIEECHYRNTVDLTKFQRFENGSYLYHETLIPPQKVKHYDYKLSFQGEMEMTAPHARGCLCDTDQSKLCVKLCCDIGEMFNYLKYRCEKIPNDGPMPTSVKIHLKNDSVKEVNLFKYFIVQIGTPCAKPQPQLGHSGTWSLLEVSALKPTECFVKNT